MTCLRSLPVRNWWPLRVEGAGCRLWGVALALLFCGAMTLARPALADNWQATLYNEGLPTHLVAVDKARQTFLFLRKKAPLNSSTRSPALRVSFRATSRFSMTCAPRKASILWNTK